MEQPNLTVIRSEITDIDLPPVNEFLEAMPPARLGFWENIDNPPEEAPIKSLDFAKGLQNSIKGQSFEDQKLAVAQMFDQLDELAADVKDGRAVVGLDDSYISGDIGGYSISEQDHEIEVALRMYELAYGRETQANFRQKDGVRLAGPFLVPVVAVRSLALIAK